MPHSEQLATRILSAQSRVKSDAMRKGEIRNEEYDRLFDAAKHLYDLKLQAND